MKISKRKLSFWNSELPLTSKRARFLISKPSEAQGLINAVRASRLPGANVKDTIIKFTSQKVAREVVKMK